MTALEDLLDHLFEGKPSELSTEVEGWLRGSRRFQTFVTTYRDKIRTKIKHAPADGGLIDLRAELATAEILLREERFTLAYETYTAARQRGPDFTVTFKTHTPFNVEVRRIRSRDLNDSDPEARISKLMNVLCDKVGQMPPSVMNMLWLYGERALDTDDFTEATVRLRQLAERKQEDYFTRRGFQNAVDFLKCYRQLSGAVLWRGGLQHLWLNSLARHPLPADLVNGLRRLEG